MRGDAESGFFRRSGRSALSFRISGEKGVVLIAVLWICALIMWFALQISAQTRLQGEDQIHSLRKSQALYIAIGGCNEALARMGQPPPLRLDDSSWQPDGKPRIVEYLTGQAVVIVESEDQKVNVNKARSPQLKQVLEKAGVDQTASESLGDFILDFIDKDDTPRLHGAEAGFYQKSGRSYGPFDGPLTSLDQLLLVPGVTDRLFYGYESRSDPTAPDMPGIYQEFLIPSKYSLFNMLTIYGNNTNLPSTFDEEETDPRPLTWKGGGVYRILSFGKTTAGPPTVAIWMTVRFNPQDRSPYKILSRKVM